jgi:serine/threonine protein kinase
MSSPLAANPADAAALAEELARFRVIDSGRLTDLLAEFPGGGAAALAEFFVHRGALSPFQAQRALAGGARWLVLGPYHLTGEANPGTFGPVYAATHRIRPGEFRLRMFPLRSLWRARQAKQIARTLAATPHPAIVPLVDADSANGFHYLVWPHAEGEPLTDRVAATGPLPPEKVAEILAHLANALHACHVLKVAHGTITPRSVVLGVDGLPQLLEHGAGAILAENLAADESLLDTLSAAVATANVLEYAAPEFATSPGSPTATADQYALGAVGYFALTGQPPFPGLSRAEQLAAKAAGVPRPIEQVNPAVPPVLAAVIGRMLRPLPGERFPGLDLVRDRLAATAGLPEPIGPLTPDTVLDVPRGGRSNRKAAQTAGSGMTPPPARNDTDEPITIQSPKPVPAAPVQVAPPPPLRIGDTPSQTVFDTRRSVPPLPSPVAPASPPSPSAPTSPPRVASPVSTEEPAMSKLALNDPFGQENAPKTPKPAKPGKPSDPRSSVGAPVQYHTEAPEDPSSGPRPGLPVAPEPGEPPPSTDSMLWKKLKRNLMFWKAPTDVVQVSVFGPPSLTPGQPAKVSVYLHAPEAADSVHTLCRAFHHDAILIGTGYVTREVAREENVGVHFSVANAGVTKSMQTLVWRGQPHRLVFDLHVPWESPGGPAPGVVSIGIDNVRIGRIEFRLHLLPRKG